MDEIKEPNSSAENAIDFRKCFAYPTENFKSKSGCVALTEMICKKKGKCPFFKTKAQYDVEHYIYGGIKKGR